MTPQDEDYLWTHSERIWGVALTFEGYKGEGMTFSLTFDPYEGHAYSVERRLAKEGISLVWEDPYTFTVSVV